MGVITQEAHLSAQVPGYLIQVMARFTRYLRESRSVDQRSGVSARFGIAAAETVASLMDRSPFEMTAPLIRFMVCTLPQ